MVAKEVLVKVKIKNTSKYDYFSGSYYVWKMFNLQIIETLKKTEKWLSVRIKLSVDWGILNTCLHNFHDLCYFAIAHT